MLDIGKIDVFMRTYNSGDIIVESLNSIKREIPVNNLIIVDGGSTDNTIAYIKSHSFYSEGKVKLFIRPDINIGLTNIFGFKQVETPWFLMIDSDIVLYEGWYRAMLGSVDDDRIKAVESGRVECYSFDIPSNEHSRGLGGQNLFKRDIVDALDEEKMDVLQIDDALIQHAVEDAGCIWKKVGFSLCEHRSPLNRFKTSRFVIYRMGDKREVALSHGVAEYKSGHHHFIEGFAYSVITPLRLWFDMSRNLFWRIVGFLFPMFFHRRISMRLKEAKSYSWDDI
jgi:glycosyltransferase involved in cell wall biosynthesis